MRIIKQILYDWAFIILSIVQWAGYMIWYALWLFSVAMLCAVVYQANFSRDANYAYTHEIYRRVVANSGQAQDALPLSIVDNKSENAITYGTRIIIHSGLINKARSWDEVAFVLGHELAHRNLKHTTNFVQVLPGQTAVLEGNADKLGAVYMMKAGFDICRGREIFMRWKAQRGNRLNSTHPSYAYRYDELNIGCE